MQNILLAALGIGLLIFIHELGHFLAARLAGVRVEVFSLGFGPRLGGFIWKGTDFRLSLVPFGGFVMVAGQDPTDRRYPARESLWSKSVAQRALFWSGGVLMNIAFALVVFPLVFHAGVSFLAPVIGRVQFGGGAWEAGLEPGDRILAVGDKPMYSFENLAVEVALHGNRPVSLLVRREGKPDRLVTAIPQFHRQEKLYVLGISPSAAPGLPTLEVLAEGAAARAGLQTGDVLLTINGKVPEGATLGSALAALDGDSDTPVDLRVRRDGSELAVVLAPTPRQKPEPPRIGVNNLPRRVTGMRQGVPFLERLGLRRGDVVLAIDDRPFLSGELSAARQGPERLRLMVVRDNARLDLEQPASAADRVVFAEAVALLGDDSLLLLPQPGMAAAAAGLRSGDRVEKVGGKPVQHWDELRAAVERADDQPLTLTIARVPQGAEPLAFDAERRDLVMSERVEVTIQPRRQPVYELGFQPKIAELREMTQATSFADALRLGMVCSLDLIKQLYVTLKRLVTGEVGSNNLGGIIRISQVSYEAAQRGPSWFWYFLALLSVNLAFVNLLPIPVLDGGHLLFLLIEKAKGSPVSSTVFGYSQVVGLVFVLLLLLFVTYNDIARFF